MSMASEFPTLKNIISRFFEGVGFEYEKNNIHFIDIVFFLMERM